MKKLFFIVFILFSLNLNAATPMSTYCSTPPFMTTSIDPNVLFILDNSGSMNEFAYHEVAGERCYNMTAWTGYDEGKQYYGYFNPDKCYKYDNTNHYFYEVGDVVDDPSTSDITERAACLASSCSVRCFSGNWLNWWTMRRTDVSKKVLTGGKYDNSTGEYVLIGTKFDRDTRRIYNDYASSDSPTDGNITPTNKNVYYTPFRRAFYSYFYYATRNSIYVPVFNVAVAKFNEEDDFTGDSCVDAYISASPDGDAYLPDDSVYENIGENISYPSYYVAVKTDTQPSGLVQSVRDKMQVGFMHFNTTGSADQGGEILNYIGDDADDVISNINNDAGWAWTPLEETLYEAMRYFKQVSPYYYSSDYSINDTWDPYYLNDAGAKVRCVKSFVVIVTDGEPTHDTDVNVSDADANFEGDGGNGDGAYMDDIAYKMHTEDLRSDISDNQLVSIYTVFAFDESEKAKNLLKRVARAGGFNDLDGDGEPYCDENCSSLWGDDFYPGSCDDGPDNCNPNCAEWDSDCDGVPDNYFEASDGYLLEQQLSSIFADILKQPSAGTSLGISYTVNRTDRADGVVQAVFYPEKIFDDDSNHYTVNWLGELYKYSPKKVEKGFEKWKAGINLTNKLPINRTIYVKDNSSNNLISLTASAISSRACGTDSTCQSEIGDIVDFIKGYQISGKRNIVIDNDNKTWKLGDIIYSSPKVDYFDSVSHSYVFVGSNDGQLHMFDYNNGEEIWSFMPDSVLPYIKYLYDSDYCHVYFVDGEPYIYSYVRSSDNSTRKVIIGSMGWGGGCGCSGSDCVNPPAETCSSPSSSSCIGKSSYFALDITTPTSPVFMWEFSDSSLGFTWSGPAFVKREDSSGNMKYFVSFVSGPTTYDGYSDQILKIFTLDLETGSLLHTESFSSLSNAFGGRLYTEGLDVNDDNQTDFFFVGYSKKTGSATSHGGVIKVWTGDEDPSNWDYNASFFNLAQNPITAKIETMKCYDNWYVFFGTGRYLYNDDDDQDINHLYGLPFPCDANNNCSPATINSAHGSDETVDCDNVGTFQGNKGGWDIELADGTSSSLKERCYSDPLTVEDSNLVYFFTATPTNDICDFGGNSKVYGLNCATGESVDNQTCDDYNSSPPAHSNLLLPTTTSYVYPIPPELNPGDDSDDYDNYHSGSGEPSYYEVPGLPPPGGGGFFAPEVEGKILLWLEK